MLWLLAGHERTSQTRLGRIARRSQGSACVGHQPRSRRRRPWWRRHLARKLCETANAACQVKS